MKHQLYETGDPRAPLAILDRNGEVVLSLCKVCGGAEGAMPTDCPGKPMSDVQLDDIHAGNLDYFAGAWAVPQCGCCGGTGKIRETEFVDGDERSCMTCNGAGM